MIGSSLLAAIQFDNEIRGIAIMVVAVGVLIGSVYLILATNSGVRLGFLIAGAALFGWMFLMGITWWMYGIGLKGRDPAWTPIEINYSRNALETQSVKSLPDPNTLPDPVEVLDRYPLLLAAARGTEGAEYEPQSLSNLVTLATPLAVIKPGQITASFVASIEKNAEEILVSNPEVAATVRGGPTRLAEELNREARALRSELEDQLGGWCLLPESDPRRGNAVAASDEALAANDAFGTDTSTASYIVLDVFFLGGKEPCVAITENSTLAQAWHRLYTAAQIKNPPQYAVVTMVKAQEVEVAPGETPPPARAEPGAKAMSVVMTLNLGNKRYIPFLFTVICGLMFAVFAWQLHTRDKRAMAARAAFEAGD